MNGIPWSEKENAFLIENAGKLSLEQIAKKLGRPFRYTEVKAGELGVANGKLLSALYTSNQFSKVMGVASSTIGRWTDLGLKYRWKKYRTSFEFKMIDIEDFYKWGESHQDLLDTRKIKVDNLGNEPGWLKEKRKKDAAQPIKRNQLWSKNEELLLVALFDAGVSKEDIATRLSRTVSGIDRKISDLKALGYLAIAPKGDFYTEAQTKTLLEYKAQGLSYRQIGLKTGRTKGGVAKKVEQLRKAGVAV